MKNNSNDVCIAVVGVDVGREICEENKYADKLATEIKIFEPASDVNPEFCASAFGDGLSVGQAVASWFESDSKELTKCFVIDGYYKDMPKDELFHHVVAEHERGECIGNFKDEDIFFYGLSETKIKEAIAKGDEYAEDFVIVSYSGYWGSL
ncbi:MAG: hypothetical protein QM504_06605 [Pseudomonadota bacterium]